MIKIDVYFFKYNTSPHDGATRMNTKLTLRIDADLIKTAKKYAENSGKSVSQLVSDYFYLLDKKKIKKSEQLGPIVTSLRGSLKNSGIDKKDYKKYLEDKYL